MPLGLSKKCSAIAPSATLAMDARAKELRSQGVNVIGFAAGEPDFETPDPIREAMKEAMDLGMTRYTPAAGTLELRRAIAARLLEDHGLVYGMDEIIVSNGAKHSLYNTFQAILDPGDEVIVDKPCWVSYPEMVRMAGGVPVFLDCPESQGFLPSMADLEKLITPRTKAFILNTPSNPNGCMWSREQLQQLADLAVKYDFYIVADEIYEKLVYSGEKHYSIATFGPEIKARTILINGVSKSYAMTGFRIGYACGPRDVIKGMVNYQSQATSAPNTAAQHAAAVALTMPQDCVEEMRKAFEQRRDRLGADQRHSRPELPQAPRRVLRDDEHSRHHRQALPRQGAGWKHRHSGSASGTCTCCAGAGSGLPGRGLLPYQLCHFHGKHRGGTSAHCRLWKGAGVNAGIQRENPSAHAGQIPV